MCWFTWMILLLVVTMLNLFPVSRLILVVPFHMKDLGALKYFLGIKVSRSNDGIYLSHKKYALDIISDCGLLAARPVDTVVWLDVWRTWL